MMASLRPSRPTRRYVLATVCAVLVALLANAPAGAVGGVPTLVEDIDPSEGSDPTGLASFEGNMYFSAAGPGGRELWKSSGEAESTFRLKNIHPGALGSNPAWLTEVGAALYFTADDGTHGRELWVTDGTGPGTHIVEDIAPSGGSDPQQLVNVGGILYFTADTSSKGRELWKSDGTVTGTRIVKNIRPGAAGSTPRELTAKGGQVIFTANDGTHGRQVWRSDGTGSGTVRMVGPVAYAAPRHLIKAGGKVFFQADNTGCCVLTRPLWRTNGTSAGTFIVDENFLGAEIDSMAAIGPTLYYLPEASGLWKSDGSEAGTDIVKADFDDPEDDDDDRARSLFNVSGTLYFLVDLETFDANPNSMRLWKSDGTEGGTVEVKQFAQQGIEPHMAGSVEELYFAAYDPATGVELWVSDGSEVGTHLVGDVNTNGTDSSDPREMTDTWGVLFFTADDGTNGREPWVLW